MAADELTERRHAQTMAAAAAAAGLRTLDDWLATNAGRIPLDNAEEEQA